MRLLLRLIALALALFFVGGPVAALAAKLRLRSQSRSGGDAESEELHLRNIFGGSDIKSRATAFRGGSILNWYGGTRLDLRDATLAPGGESAR